MKQQRGKIILISLAISTVHRAQGGSGLEQARHHGGDFAIGHSHLPDGSSTSSPATPVDSGNGAWTPPGLLEDSIRSIIGGLPVCDANGPPADLFREPVHDRMESLGALAMSMYAAFGTFGRETLGRMTNTLSVAATPRDRSKAALMEGRSSANQTTTAGPRGARTESGSLSGDGNESPLSGVSRIPAGPDEDGTLTAAQSLAPGWKQQASWGPGGAGLWMGTCVCALIWAVLLC